MVMKIPTEIFPQNCKITKFRLPEQFGFGIIDIRLNSELHKESRQDKLSTNNHNQNLLDLICSR